MVLKEATIQVITCPSTPDFQYFIRTMIAKHTMCAPFFRLLALFDPFVAPSLLFDEVFWRTGRRRKCENPNSTGFFRFREEMRTGGGMRRIGLFTQL